MEQQSLETAPSLGKTIVDVFAGPADAFQAIKNTAPSTSIWLAPMVSMILIIICTSVLLFTNDALKTDFRDMQSRMMQQRVEQGKLTQSQAEQAESRMDSMGGLMIVIGVVFGTAAVALYYFGGSLFLWLAGKSAAAGITIALVLWALWTAISVFLGIAR